MGTNAIIEELGWKVAYHRGPPDWATFNCKTMQEVSIPFYLFDINYVIKTTYMTSICIWKYWNSILNSLYRLEICALIFLYYVNKDHLYRKSVFAYGNIDFDSILNSTVQIYKEI